MSTVYKRTGTAVRRLQQIEKKDRVSHLSNTLRVSGYPRKHFPKVKTIERAYLIYQYALCIIHISHSCRMLNLSNDELTNVRPFMDIKAFASVMTFCSPVHEVEFVAFCLTLFG